MSWPYATYDSESNQALQILRSRIPIDERTQKACLDLIFERGSPEYLYQVLRLPLARTEWARFMRKLIRSGECKVSYKTLWKIKPKGSAQRMSLIANVERKQCYQCASLALMHCKDLSQQERSSLFNVIVAHGDLYHVGLAIRKRRPITPNQLQRLRARYHQIVDV